MRRPLLAASPPQAQPWPLHVGVAPEGVVLVVPPPGQTWGPRGGCRAWAGVASRGGGFHRVTSKPSRARAPLGAPTWKCSPPWSPGPCLHPEPHTRPGKVLLGSGPPFLPTSYPRTTATHSTGQAGDPLPPLSPGPLTEHALVCSEDTGWGAPLMAPDVRALGKGPGQSLRGHSWVGPQWRDRARGASPQLPPAGQQDQGPEVGPHVVHSRSQVSLMLPLPCGGPWVGVQSRMRWG